MGHRLLSRIDEFTLFYSTFIASLFLSILVLFQLSFIFKIQHFSIILPLSVLLAYFVTKKIMISHIKVSNWFIIIGVFLLSGIIAFFSFDKAGDSRWYHQAIIVLLKNGWNPIHDYSKFKFNGDYTALIMQTYSQANEILALAFVAVFKHIQIGKIINLLFAIYGLSVTYLALKLVFELTPKQNILICIYLTFNPIFAAQYLSYYLDANFLVCFEVLLFSLLIWMKTLIAEKVSTQKFKLDVVGYNLSLFSILNIFASCIMLSNLKFTGLVYSMIILAVFGISKYIYEYKILNITIMQIILKNYFHVIIIGSALILMSYHPYVQNIIANKSPLWPLMGQDSPIMLTTWSALSWSPYNKFITLLITYFLPYPATYPPFSFMPSIKSFVAADYSICALGPFYGLFLIISLYYCIKYLKRMWYGIKTDFVCLAITICIASILISTIANPYFMYLRYVPQMILLPAIAIIILFKFKAAWFNNKIQKIFIIMCIINSGLFFGGATILTAYRTHKFMQMENICRYEHCTLEIQHHNIFERSLLNQIAEDGITFTMSSCYNKVIMLI